MVSDLTFGSSVHLEFILCVVSRNVLILFFYM